MKNLTQTDLNVRLQLLNCKYATLTNVVNNNLLAGTKCAPKLINDLLLLDGYINVLNNYKITKNTLSVFMLKIAPFVAYNSYILYIDGVAITDSLTSVENTDIVNSINSKNIPGISAVVDGEYTKITAKCSSQTVKVVGENYPPIYTLIKTVIGCCPETNCYTEQEIQELIDNAAKLTEMCFQALNYTYKPNT